MNLPGALTALLTLTAAAVAPATFAADWPQWRGMNRDGVSTETGLLKEWPKEGPPLLWETSGAGRGYSSLAVAAGKVYTVGDGLPGADPDEEYLVCFNEADGKLAWKAKLGGRYMNRNKQWDSSRSTPTIDGELLYVLTGNGELICLETAGGKERWRKSLPKDFGGKKGDTWGYSESPLVDGDRVVCTPGGETTMAALDKKTGETLWTARLPEKPGAGHASVMPADIGKTRVYVQTTAGYGLGVRAADGKVLWTKDKFGATAVIPTPIVRGDLVLLAAGYGLGGTLLRQVPDGDGVKVETVYPLTRELNNKHGGLVLVGDYVYGDTDDLGIPFCVEFLTGKQKWKARAGSSNASGGGQAGRRRGSGLGSGAVAAADGRIYFHFANGKVILVEANPEGYKEVGSFTAPHAGERPSWAHPVIANGKLFIREGNHVLCYDIKAK